MSDKLTLSATFSVLMMAIYVLFGNEATRAPFGPASLPASLDALVRVATPSLPSLDVVFASAKPRHILY